MTIREIDMASHLPAVRKILTLGDYGSGKTNFMSTLADYEPAAPTLLYSFDKGYDTTAMKPGVMVVEILEEDRKRPKAWVEFNEHFRKFTAGKLEYTWPDGRKERFNSCALDSLTFLSMFCMNHYQWMGSNVDKKATYTQYQQILENMQDVVDAAKRCTEWVICSALVKIERDDLTGEVLALPNITGSLRDHLGANFDAVFYQFVDKKPQGETVYK